jgi:RNA polymerase-binding transcription factor DksA
MSQSITPIKASGPYRRLLVEKQAELLAELKSRREDVAELLEPVPEEDQPAVAQESSISEQLSAIESIELSRVNAALKRLRTEAYGICERCGSSIPAARLMAIPWAEHCRRCEAQMPEEHVATIGRAH